jgi:hypothetical protein
MKSVEPRKRLDSHGSSLVGTSYSGTALPRIASRIRAKVRTDKLQPVIRAASMLRTLMKDARGGLIR